MVEVVPGVGYVSHMAPNTKGKPQFTIPRTFQDSRFRGKQVQIHRLIWRFENEFRSAPDALSHRFKPGVDVVTGEAIAPAKEGDANPVVGQTEDEDRELNESRKPCHRLGYWQQVRNGVVRCMHWPPCTGPVKQAPPEETLVPPEGEAGLRPPIRAVIAEFANSRLYRSYLQARGGQWGEGVRLYTCPVNERIPFDVGGGRKYTIARAAPHTSEVVEPGAAI